MTNEKLQSVALTVTRGQCNALLHFISAPMRKAPEGPEVSSMVSVAVRDSLVSLRKDEREADNSLDWYDFQRKLFEAFMGHECPPEEILHDWVIDYSSSSNMEFFWGTKLHEPPKGKSYSHEELHKLCRFHVTVPKWLAWRTFGTLVDKRFAWSIPAALEADPGAIGVAAQKVIFDEIGLELPPHQDFEIAEFESGGLRMARLRWGKQTAEVPLDLLVEGIVAQVAHLPGDKRVP